MNTQRHWVKSSHQHTKHWDKPPHHRTVATSQAQLANTLRHWIKSTHQHTKHWDKPAHHYTVALSKVNSSTHRDIESSQLTNNQKGTVSNQLTNTDAEALSQVNSPTTKKALSQIESTHRGTESSQLTNNQKGTESNQLTNTQRHWVKSLTHQHTKARSQWGRLPTVRCCCTSLDPPLPLLKCGSEGKHRSRCHRSSQSQQRVWLRRVRAWLRTILLHVKKKKKKKRKKYWSFSLLKWYTYCASFAFGTKCFTPRLWECCYVQNLCI